MLIIIAWLTRENFAGHRRLDPLGLQSTFKEWEKSAQAGVQQAERDGTACVRQVIDPEELAVWCRASGRKVDASSRAQFAIVAYQRASRH